MLAKAFETLTDACPYCADWNQRHPDTPRDSCGPCEVCGRPGHVGAHPRKPVSLCLCPEHGSQETDSGDHFERYRRIDLLIGLGVVGAVYRLW
ncbi:MAG: hypothetical protein ACOZB0_02030 [Pseudomonadota bacterium]